MLREGFFIYLTNLRIIVTRYLPTLDCMNMILRFLSSVCLFFFFFSSAETPNARYGMFTYIFEQDSFLCTQNVSLTLIYIVNYILNKLQTTTTK